MSPYRTAQRTPAPEQGGWFSRWRRKIKEKKARKDLESAVRKAVILISPRYTCITCSKTDCVIHGMRSARELGRCCTHSDDMDVENPRVCQYCRRVVLPKPPLSIESISAQGFLRKKDVINFYYWNTVNKQVLTDEELVELKSMADRLFGSV